MKIFLLKRRGISCWNPHRQPITSAASVIAPWAARIISKSTIKHAIRTFRLRTNGLVAGHAAITIAAPQVLSPTATSLDISPAPKTSEEENGYQLLFLSARAIVQAYLTKRFLSNLKQDIKALLPPDYNPFYAGFWNRDTDELSDRKIGIPKGKNFIINPKGKVAINHQIDVKSFTSLHTLVKDMFPPTFMVEQVLLNVNSFKIYQ